MEVPRIRRYILLHLHFRRRLLRSLFLLVMLALLAFVAVICHDYAIAVGRMRRQIAEADEERRKANATGGGGINGPNPISACRAWFNLVDDGSSGDLLDFDAFRSCSIESALRRVDKNSAVCLISDSAADDETIRRMKMMEKTEWFKQLKVSSR